jgi:phenylalanyl-tRNA synthetase beta chain
MGLKKWEIKQTRHSSFLDGRVAVILLKRKELGVLGEVHPEVLNNFELENPTSAFEIDIEEI